MNLKRFSKQQKNDTTKKYLLTQGLKILDVGSIEPKFIKVGQVGLKMGWNIYFQLVEEAFLFIQSSDYVCMFKYLSKNKIIRYIHSGKIT